MTVPANNVRNQYNGDGVTVAFTFTGKLLDQAHVKVVTLNTLDPLADPAGIPKVITTDYTVTGVGGSSATVLMNISPAFGVRVTLSYNIPLTQQADYVDNDSFPAESHEAALDKLTLIVQQQQDTLGRAAVFPSTSAATLAPTLPPIPVDNLVVAWDGVTGKMKNGPTVADIEDAAIAAASAIAAAGTATTAAAQAVAAASSVTYLWCGTASGTANALVLTPSPAISANTAGQKFRFVVNSANTGSVIAAVSGQASLSIKKSIGGALVSLVQGDLPVGTIAEIENTDGATFQLINVRPYNQGAAIASAATVNLDTATGDYIHITGTTGISTITLAQGQQRTVVFDGVLTLTNSASLILPSGANITTAAGDTCVVRGEASGVARIVSYARASGASLTGGAGGAFKNLIIGGDLTKNPWQRGTTFTSLATASYSADRFLWTFVGAGVVDVLKTADAPTIAQAGVFTQHCLHVDCTTVDASIAVTDTYSIRQKVEGLNCVQAGFGQTGGLSVTLSFWHKHTKTGTYCVAIKNSAANRSYVAEYTQAVTDTWELATVVIPADTTGTWLYDTSTGLDVHFTIAAGSNFQATVNTWSAGSFHATASQVNGLDNTANNFKLALIQLEIGAAASAFESLPEDVILQRCLRYYWRNTVDSGAAFFAHGIGQSTTAAEVEGKFPVIMNSQPTLQTTGTAADYQMLLGNSSVTCNAVPGLSTGPTTGQAFALDCHTASGMADKGPVILASTGSGVYLAFSAEL